MAKCPFMSGVYYNTDTSEAVTYQLDCIEDDCQLWDATNERCGAFTSDLVKQIKDLKQHIHNQHEHEIQHDADTESLSYGNAYNADYNTKKMAVATILMQEMMNNEDLDNNGSIYWRDFIIDPDDDDKPDLLVSVEEGQSGAPPSTTVGWSEFLEDNIVS